MRFYHTLEGMKSRKLFYLKKKYTDIRAGVCVCADARARARVYVRM